MYALCYVLDNSKRLSSLELAYILYPKKDKNQRVAIEGKSPVALHDYCEQDISVP